MRMGRRGKPGSVPHLAQKGGAYYYVTGTGKRKWIALGSDKARALARWAELEGRTNSGTFGDLFRWFMANATIAESTRKNYEIQGAAVLKIFETAPPDSVSAEMISTFKKKSVSPQAGKLKCSTGTANVRIGIMKSVYAAAIEQGLCKTNPARDVSRYRRVIRDRYIDDAEFVAIRDKAEDFLRVAMNIAYQIGCRPGDVCQMKLSDVTPDGVILTAQKTKKKTLYSDAPELRAALDDAKALERGVKSLYVLSDWRGRPYTVARLRKAWIAACKAAEVESAQQRDIRAKTASDDPDGAQKRLQHTDARTTDGYIRKMPVVTPISRKL